MPTGRSKIAFGVPLPFSGNSNVIVRVSATLEQQILDWSVYGGDHFLTGCRPRSPFDSAPLQVSDAFESWKVAGALHALWQC